MVSSPDSETNYGLLKALEADRYTVLTDREYQEMRSLIIRELSRGPQFERSYIVTFSTLGFLFFALFCGGLFAFFRRIIPDLSLAAAALGALGVWGFMLWSYWKDLRQRSGRSVDQRLAELKQLRLDSLVSQEEFDRIYAAIMMSRTRSLP